MAMTEESSAVRLPVFWAVDDIPKGQPLYLGEVSSSSRAVLRLIAQTRKDLSVIGVISDDREGDVENLMVTPPLQAPPDGYPILLTGHDWLHRLAAFPRELRSRCRVYRNQSLATGMKPSIVIKEASVIFVPVYKAAYSSISAFLRTNLVSQPSTRLPPRLVDITHARYRSYFKFSFVRNPWDRAVSCYANRFHEDSNLTSQRYFLSPLKEILGKERITFRDYVSFVARVPDDASDPHWRSQTLSLYAHASTPVVDFIGRLENISDDIKFVFDQIGYQGPSEDVPHKQNSVGRFREADYQQYYDEETSEYVRRRYAQDVENFGYEFSQPAVP